MNDTVIISTISKTYFIIVSFFIFILLLLTTIFIILQNGLYIENISIQNIKIKQLYIKWDEKIDLSIQKISLIEKKSHNQSKFKYKDIEKYLKVLTYYGHLFNGITIEKIHLDNISASLKYREKEESYLLASSPFFEFQSQLYFEEDFFNIHITKLKSLKKNVSLKGDIYFSPKETSLYSDFKININDDLNSDIYIRLNTKKMIYKLKNYKDIKNIKYLFNLLNAPKELNFWVLDAIDMKSVTIENASGFIEFEKPELALKNISIKAIVNNLNYTYNTQLDAIHTKSTELEFKQGIFFIRPKEAYSYGMFLDKSWIKIDFTKPDEILTLHLLFDGILNKEILNILKTYKIHIPFLQKEGKVKTNLTLNINLQTIDVDAQGDFLVKQGNFDYLGMNLDIYNAHIHLDNYDVSIDNMQVAYKKIVTSSVDVMYDAKKSKGLIVFKVSKINMFKNKLLLKQLPLKITYNISPEKDSIHVGKSQWLYAKSHIIVDPITFPFDLEKKILNIPTTYFDIQNISNGFIGGRVDLKNLTASLNADILKFQYNDIKLHESNTQLKIQYDKNLTIFSKEKVSFNIDDLNVNIRNFSCGISDKFIFIKDTYLSIDNLIYTKINSIYNISNVKNNVNLEYIHIKKDGKKIFNKKNLQLDIETVDDTTIISSKALDSQLKMNNKGWKFSINSLNKFLKYSTFTVLKSTKGDATFSKKNNKKIIKFNMNTISDYKFLISSNKYLKKYKIDGKIQDKKTDIKINNNLMIALNDKINIYMKNSGINVPEVLRFVDDLNISTDDNNSKNILLHGTHIYFDFGSNRKIVSDEIELQQDNLITTAQLKYKNGTAGFRMQNKVFHLYGKNFNDKFMENIFSLSKFKGGSLEFSVKGTLEDYSGAFYIDNTTMLDYKLMNNILAFVNTIPSLITFSLPGYSKHGLDVQTSYAKFHAKDGVFNISDFLVDSKEINIEGKGIANIGQDTIDVTLNLKSDLGSTASKIPIVGYILFDGDSMSTTMRITGKLSNPEVHSLLAKEIVVAPLNIIKRTILFPFKILTGFNDDNTTTK